MLLHEANPRWRAGADGDMAALLHQCGRHSRRTDNEQGLHDGHGIPVASTDDKHVLLCELGEGSVAQETFVYCTAWERVLCFSEKRMGVKMARES